MFRYDRLDELIKETGIKKNYLSQKMGFSGRYLNDAKKQNTDIKGKPLQILADELKTTPEYLTGATDEKEQKENPTAKDGEVKVLTPDRYEDFLHELSVEELLALNAAIGDALKGRLGK